MDPLLVVTLHGVRAVLDDDGRWRAEDPAVTAALDLLTPPNTPDVPDWPRLVADILAQAFGPDLVVLERAAVENVPGRVY